jgi:hypothetical protein
MKSLFAALLIVSTSAFALTPTQSAFLSVLPEGNYVGSYNSSPCSLSVSNYGDSVVYEASNFQLTTKRVLTLQSTHAPRRGALLSSDIVDLRNGRKENFIRTVPVTEATRYVAVGDIFTSEYPNGNSESVVECVVNL